MNYNHSWFDEKDKETTYLMAELRSETDYAPHHIQKVCAFFIAMREFAKQLEKGGHRVIYKKFNKENPRDFKTLVKEVLGSGDFERFEYMSPDEFRLDEHLKALAEELNVTCRVFDTEHFYTSRRQLTEFFKGKKTYLLESFYRDLRKKHDVMMNGNQPVTGQWNYDKENRSKYTGKLPLPEKLLFEHDAEDIVKQLADEGVKTIGIIEKNKSWRPANREESLQLLEHFAEKALPAFGKYQDAMTGGDWLLFHSNLSFAMNVKMLNPREVVNRCVEEWEKRPDAISIAQIEGFVRQILGWREYMRGVYWAKMPGYAQKNFFEFERPLPKWYWTGKTDMNCLKHAVSQSLEKSYAHHIQRLMVTGNFALLAGCDPDAVDQWYLGIYADALEWVEITNTRGMSQFADGGIVGTKPYISSASYMNKMSDYCQSCKYAHTKKTEENACPFNSLYWRFYAVNRNKLGKNPRIGMMYRVWDKMDKQKQNDLLDKADYYLKNIEKL